MNHYNAFVIGTIRNVRFIKRYKSKTLAFILEEIKKMGMTNWALHHSTVHNTSEPDGLIAFSVDNHYWNNLYK